MFGKYIKRLIFRAHSIVEIPVEEFSYRELLLLISIKRSKFVKIQEIKYSDVNQPFFYIFRNNPPNDITARKANGKSFFSRKEAFMRTVGEACERHNWNSFVPDSYIDSTESKLKKDAIPVRTFAGLGIENKGSEFETKLRWVDVDELTATKVLRRLCPLQIISPLYHYAATESSQKNQSPHEPNIRSMTSSGVSAGWVREERILQGALEVIERDAFILNYLLKSSPNKISIKNLPVHIEGLSLEEVEKRYGLEIHLLKLQTSFRVYSVVALVISHKYPPALSIGASAGFDLVNTIQHALEEAFTSRIYGEALERHELDVTYSMSQNDRKIFWSKKENLKHIDFFINGKTFVLKHYMDTEIESVKNMATNLKLKFLVKTVLENGCHIFYRDLPNDDYTSEYSAGVTIIPECQPLYLYEKYLSKYGVRLEALQKKFNVKYLNDIPHPLH